MVIVAGQTYTGVAGPGRIVQAVDGTTITYRQKMSGRLGTCTSAEFVAWMGASQG